jgi:DNA-binding LytR/AlgR family response regulator
MIQVVIVEDETGASQYLEDVLSEIAPDVHVIHKLDNVESAVQWFSGHEADLIFLDIQLGDDIAFSIFERLRIKTPVIFTTAYNEYAIRAFTLNGIDYLLKPYSETDLKRALGKFRAQHPKMGIDVSAMLRTLKQKDFQRRFLAVNGKKIKSVPIAQVAYFLAQGRYTQLVTKANEKYLLDHSLENIIGRIDPQLFFRVNRQMIVGFDAITHMMAWSRSRIKIELMPAAEIEVISSIDNTAEFRRWLDR